MGELIGELWGKHHGNLILTARVSEDIPNNTG
jgi:hypothetical protein